MITLKTNKIKTWDINYPFRYSFKIKKLPNIEIPPPEETTPSFPQIKTNFIIKIKR